MLCVPRPIEGDREKEDEKEKEREREATIQRDREKSRIGPSGIMPGIIGDPVGNLASIAPLFCASERERAEYGTPGPSRKRGKPTTALDLSARRISHSSRQFCGYTRQDYRAERHRSRRAPSLP